MEEKTNVVTVSGIGVEIPLKAMQPEHSYWKVSVQVIVDEAQEEGKPSKFKKKKEVHLVDAENHKDLAEKLDKVLSAMYDEDDSVIQWKVTSIAESNVVIVY